MAAVQHHNPQLSAELCCINFVSGGWNEPGRLALVNLFIQRWNIQNPATLLALYNHYVQPQDRPQWVSSNTYPQPPPTPVTTNQDKMNNVQNDENEIIRRFHNNILRLLIKFPPGHPKIPEQYGDGSTDELLITFPPSRDSDFTNYCVEFLKLEPCVKYCYPVILYFSVALYHTRASHWLIRELPIVHMGSSFYYRLGRYGNLMRIDIDEEILNRRPPAADIIAMSRSNFDNNATDPQQRNGLLALRHNGAQQLSPPNGQELNSTAYRATQFNKDRCPGLQELIARIGQERVDEIDNICRHQLGWIGGLARFLTKNEGKIVILPGDMVSEIGMALDPHHLNKQFNKAQGPNAMRRNLWREVLDAFRLVANGASRLRRRARQYLHVASTVIRPYLLSLGYQRQDASNSGRHAYAHVNMLRGKSFHLTHQDRYAVNLPSDSNNLLSDDHEHGDCFTTQVIATHDSKEVHAIGLDATGLPGNYYLVRWGVPVVSIASFHHSNGPASNPILGSLVTDTEDFYRGTLTPFQYRYAALTSSEGM